jgi:hypothetical protein
MALTRITTGAIGSNVISAEKMQNASIQARHLQTGTITLDLMDANANVAAAETRLNANLDIVQDNVTVIINNINIVQDNVVLAEANVVAAESRLNSNLDATSTNVAAVIANADALGTYANTNLDTKANVSATYFLALANDYATYTLLNANLDVLQDNITAIHSGSQEFTTNKIFQQNVVVQGNLIVVGSQVDLGVGTATIDDNFIVVSANLTGVPATDSGIIINRGSEGNVFIGDHIGEDAIVFATTQSPHDNATIAIQEYIDVHANAFHAHQSMDFNVVHFGHVNDESTGIIIDTSNTQIKFIIGGTEVANLDAQANLALNDGRLTGNPNADGDRNAIDLDVDEESDVINSVSIESVNSIFFLIDKNNNGDNPNAYIGVFNDVADLSASTREDAIFSIRDHGEVFVSDDISVQGNANILLDAVVSNAVIGTRVFEGTVGLQANDSATYFAAYANDFVTYTRLNANVNAVQSNLSTAHTDLSSNIDVVQDNVAALTGGGTFLSPFVNTNSATGTSNVFFIGKDTASYANIITVTLDGVFQANTEYVANFANDTIQFTDATIPSGTIVTIFSMT